MKQSGQLKINIKLLCSKYYRAYEEFVSHHEDALIYYSLKYGMFLGKLLGCESRYYIACDEKNKVLGVLPLMKYNAVNGTSVINSLPFYGSHGGILSNDINATNELLNRYVEEIEALNVVSATLVEHPYNPKWKNIPYTHIESRISQITDINMSETELLCSFEGSTRRNIKKAQNNKVIVKKKNDAWEFLEDTHSSNMNAIGGLSKNHRFFEVIPEIFEGYKDFNIYVADWNGRSIAALLVMYYGETVEYFMPATVHEARKLQPLPLIIFEAMKEARNDGYKYWNWGGTWTSQTGVYRFKKKFAAKQKEYKYYTWLKDKEILNEKPDTLLANYPNFFVIPFDQLN